MYQKFTLHSTYTTPRKNQEKKAILQRPEFIIVTAVKLKGVHLPTEAVSRNLVIANLGGWYDRTGTCFMTIDCGTFAPVSPLFHRP